MSFSNLGRAAEMELSFVAEDNSSSSNTTTGGMIERGFMDEEEGSSNSNTIAKPYRDVLLMEPSNEEASSSDGTASLTPEQKNSGLFAIKRRNNVPYYYLAGLFLVVVVMAISIPLALSSKKHNGSSSSSAAPSTSNTMTGTEAPEDTRDPSRGSVLDILSTTEAPTIAEEDTTPAPDAVTTPSTAVAPFSKDVLTAYTDIEALKADLTLAATDLVKQVIAVNLEELRLFGPANTNTTTAAPVVPDNRRLTKQAGTTTASTTNTATKKTSRTNNQEHDVDEADSVKEDGTYVYASYGDTLVIWDRQGTIIASDQMPLPMLNNNVPYIQGLQTTDDHILVFVAGYAPDTTLVNLNRTDVVTFGHNETRLQVYTKPTADDADVILVATQAIHGVYHSSRVLSDGSIHVVTTATVNHYEHLQDPLSMLNFAGAANDPAGYATEATALAETTLIPAFVDALAGELMTDTEDQVLKVNNWKRTASDPLAPQELQVDDRALKSYVQVVSIHPSNFPGPADGFLDNALTTHKTIFLSPAESSHVYAKDQHVVVAVEPSKFDTREDDHVFLIHLEVDTANQYTMTIPYSVAALDGHLAKGSRSIDIVNNDLRVAVTHQKTTNGPLDGVYAICGSMPGAFAAMEEDACMTQEAWALCHDLSLSTECDNVNLTKVEETETTACRYDVGCFDSTPAPEGFSTSRTKNYVMALSLEDAGDMRELGGVGIGNDNDVITSVHFGDSFSYVTTSFMANEGLYYILILPEGGAPVISSEIVLDEAVSYLQPLNDNGSDSNLLVAIGQNGTGVGALRIDTGVFVSVIDVTNPRQPMTVATRMLNENDGSRVYSISQFDAKAVQHSSRTGRLVVPLSIKPGPVDFLVLNLTIADMETYAWEEPFKGFVVLDVSDVATNGIREDFRLNHIPPSDQCRYCRYGGTSDYRSFLYDDEVDTEVSSVMTIHNQIVFSSDLLTKETIWALTIALPGKENGCCG